MLRRGGGETVEHNDSHQVLEVRQSDFQVVRNGDSDTHTLIYHYDLFCVDCGRVIQKDARQESFQENHYWTVGRKDPTCDAEGEDIRICSLCGAQVITSIPALGHDWSEWKEEEIPLSLQCVTDRSEKRTCQRCGKEETQIMAPAPGHQWVALENIPATCTEPGRSVRQCSSALRSRCMSSRLDRSSNRSSSEAITSWISSAVPSFPVSR